MKNIKLWLIVVLVFLSAMCFATKEEDIAAEEKELNEAILAPIVGHFPASSSYTWRISEAIIRYERSNKKEFSKYEASNYVEKLLATPEFKDIDKAVCDWRAISKIDARDVNGFVAKLRLTWRMGIIQCGGYADLAMLTFNFNMMNYQARGVKPIFKSAVFVVALRNNGDHAFILVEGDSGTVFAVDPWVRLDKDMSPRSGMVERLPGFPKLSTITSWNGGVYRLSQEDNDRLNNLFGYKENGKLYYDGMYVTKHTEWILDRATADKIGCMIKSGDAIKIMYEELNFSHTFIQWKIDYDRLLQWQKDHDRLITLPVEKDSQTCSLM